MLNPKIEKARQAALDLLKPSEKDLEHGLALHAGSLVVESYGLPPRAAVDADALNAAVEAGASPREAGAMMTDMILTRMVTDPRQHAEYAEAWEASGVDCMLPMAGQMNQSPLELIHCLAHMTYTADLAGVVDRAVTPDDIAASREKGKPCFYMSAIGVPLTQSWECVEEELTYIRIVF